jgi:CRP/FNR family cyclic AMP-dependent transcriptional regulator
MGLSEIEVLAKTSLFGSMPRTELQRVGRLLRARQYTRGEVIFLEGDIGTALCLIAEGRVRIQLTGTDGREVTLNVYGSGEIFGEMSLLDGEPRSADAIAQEASRVFWLQRDDFAAFLAAHSSAAMTMLAGLSRRLRRTTRLVQDSAFRDVPGRMARVLLELMETYGHATAAGVRIELRLTQTELGALVGTTRESVNRTLHDFEHLGLLQWAAGGITITQVQHLRARADRMGGS